MVSSSPKIEHPVNGNETHIWGSLPSGKRLQNTMENHHAINGTIHYNGDFPQFFVGLPEGNPINRSLKKNQ